MADYRNDRDLDRTQPKTVQAERSGSSIFLIVAAVIALLAILWFAFSGGDDATTATQPTVMEQSAPAAPEGTEAAPQSNTVITPEGGTTGVQPSTGGTTDGESASPQGGATTDNQ